MKKENTFILTIVIFSVLLLGGQLGIFSVFNFEYGYEPYGESPNQITDLINTGMVDGYQTYDSLYWEILAPKMGNTLYCSEVFGSDFNLVTAKPKSGKCDTFGGIDIDGENILITKEDFSDKDFKTIIESNPTGETGTANKWFSSTSVKIYLLGDKEIEVVNHEFERVGNPSDLNILISPSVLSDKIYIYENGLPTKEVNLEGNYKIKVITTATCGCKNQGKMNCDATVVIKEPSYKQSFGCSVETDEQYYVSIFNEGDKVNLQKLDNFVKFCLEESPLKVYSNIGSTTEVEPLQGLVNGEDYNVPSGQIWSIEYIGKKTNFVTECESNQAYSLQDKECLSRAILTFNCPSGSEFNLEKGYCTTETEPYEYISTKISTHQLLETNGKFLFSHQRNNYDKETDNSFNIGNQVFSSNGPLNENTARFSFEGESYDTSLNQDIALDEYLSVELTALQTYHSDYGLKRFNVEYVFDLDTSFIEVDYEDEKAIVTNSYKTFEGGIILTTTDNLGKTTVKNIDKQLSLGTTEFELDLPDNILEVKIRPYVNIDTLLYDYTLDTRYAVKVDIDDGLIEEVEEQEETEEIYEIEQTDVLFDVNKFLEDYWMYLVGLLALLFGIYLIKK